MFSKNMFQMFVKFLETNPSSKNFLFQFGVNVARIINKITNEVDVKPENVIILSPIPIHQAKFESNRAFAG